MMDYIEKNERQNEYLHRFQLRELAEAWLAQAAAECPADPYAFLITEAAQQRERGGGIVTCPNPWCEMTMPAAEFNTHSMTCKDEHNWLRCVRCNCRVEVSRAAQHALHCRVQSCPMCGEIVLPRLMPLCPFKIFQAAERDRLAFAYKNREEAEKIEAAASEALTLHQQQQQQPNQAASVSGRLIAASSKSTIDSNGSTATTATPSAARAQDIPTPHPPLPPAPPNKKELEANARSQPSNADEAGAALLAVPALSDRALNAVQKVQRIWRRILVTQRFRILFFRIIWSRLDLMQEKSVSAPPKNRDTHTQKITAKAFPRWSSAREHSNDESFMLELQSLLLLNDDEEMPLEHNEERSNPARSVYHQQGGGRAGGARDRAYQGSSSGSAGQPHTGKDGHADSPMNESISSSTSSGGSQRGNRGRRRSTKTTHVTGHSHNQAPAPTRFYDDLPSVIGSASSDYGEEVITLYDEPDAQGAFMSVADMDELIRLNHRRAVLPIRTVVRIIRAATRILSARPVVQHVMIPSQGDVVVVGDLHGQMKDIYHIIQLMGRPSAERHFVFNGDFVDRGPNCCEVIVFVFALLCTYPHHVHINRGNHEDAHTNTEYGLLTELFGKYKSAAPFLHQELINSYEAMSLMTVLDRRVLVVHGGVPRVPCTLAEVEAVGHVRDIPVAEQRNRAEQLLVDVLWNDPVEQYRSRALGTRHNGEGWRSSRRGCGAEYVATVTERFLQMNGLSLVIRSHDVKMPGFEIAHHNRTVTVFSASNYGGVSGNRGAVAVVKKSDDMPLFQTWFLREDIQGAGLLTQLSGAATQATATTATTATGTAAGGAATLVAAEVDSVARAAAGATVELNPLGLTDQDGAGSVGGSAKQSNAFATASSSGRTASAAQGGSTTVRVNTVEDTVREKAEDGTAYFLVPNMAKVEEEVLVRSDEFVQTHYENFALPTPLVRAEDVSDEAVQQYRRYNQLVMTEDRYAGLRNPPDTAEVCYRTCLPIIMQVGVMYELREMIYNHRYTLLIGFTAADDEGTGIIYEMEWCAVMRDVLRLDLPWYYVFKFVNTDVLLLDGIRSVSYVKFLRRFDAAFTANHLCGWQRAMIRRIFAAADLPDDLIATFQDSCVYRLSERGRDGTTTRATPTLTKHAHQHRHPHTQSNFTNPFSASAAATARSSLNDAGGVGGNEEGPGGVRSSGGGSHMTAARLSDSAPAAHTAAHRDSLNHTNQNVPTRTSNTTIDDNHSNHSNNSNSSNSNSRNAMHHGAHTLFHHPRMHVCTRVVAGQSVMNVFDVDDLDDGVSHVQSAGESETERWRQGMCSFRVFASRIRSISVAAAVLDDNLVYSLFEYFDRSMRGHVSLGCLADLITEAVDDGDEGDSSESLQVMESGEFSFTAPVLPASMKAEEEGKDDGGATTRRPTLKTDVDVVFASTVSMDEASAARCGRAGEDMETAAARTLVVSSPNASSSSGSSGMKPKSSLAALLQQAKRSLANSTAMNNVATTTTTTTITTNNSVDTANTAGNASVEDKADKEQSSWTTSLDFESDAVRLGRGGSFSDVPVMDDAETDLVDQRWQLEADEWRADHQQRQQQRLPGEAAGGGVGTGGGAVKGRAVSPTVMLSMEDNGPQLQLGRLGQWSAREGAAGHTKRHALHSSVDHSVPTDAARGGGGAGPRATKGREGMSHTSAARPSPEGEGQGLKKDSSDPLRNSMSRSNNGNSCSSLNAHGIGDRRVDAWLYPFLLRMQDIFLGGSTYTRMRTLFQMLNESKDGRLSCEELLKLVDFVNSQIDSPITEEQARVVFHYVRQEGIDHNRRLYLMQQERYARSIRSLYDGEAPGVSPPPPASASSPLRKKSRKSVAKNGKAATTTAKLSATDYERVMCAAHTPAYPTLKERLDEEERVGKAFILFPELVGLFTVNAVLSDRMVGGEEVTSGAVVGDGAAAMSSSVSVNTLRPLCSSVNHTHTPSDSSLSMQPMSSVNNNVSRSRVAVGASSAQLSNAAAREMAKRRGSAEGGESGPGLTTSQQMMQALTHLQESYGPTATLRDIMTALNGGLGNGSMHSRSEQQQQQQQRDESSGGANAMPPLQSVSDGRKEVLSTVKELPAQPQQRQLSKKPRTSLPNLIRKHIKPARSQSPVLPIN